MRIRETSIPESLLTKAYAVAVIPSVMKAGLVFGGRFGKGAISVRKADNSWSNPSFIKLKGGSWGLQIGISETDLILVFKNKKGVDGITGGKLTLGADASVAAGPVGRTGSAATDIKFDAEVYSHQAQSSTRNPRAHFPLSRRLRPGALSRPKFVARRQSEHRCQLRRWYC